jgi:general secretion pathway protein E
MKSKQAGRKSKKNVPRESGKRRSSSSRAMSAHAQDDLLAADEAASLLKTSRQTLYSWVRTGKIRGMKVGRQWRFEREEIDRFLKGEEPKVELRTDISPLIESLEEQAEELEACDISLAQETPVQRAIAQIIRLGMAMHASHIHIHPNLGEDGTTRVAVVRYRVDGTLQVAAEIDMRLLPPIMEQWKLLLSLNPKETRQQQARSLKVRYGDSWSELSCQFGACELGEMLTVRNLFSGESLSLDQLGLSVPDTEKLRCAIEAPSGLVVLTAPSGAGRTTTAYACLQHLAGPERKICTIEDSVTRRLPWVVQLCLYVHVAMDFPFAIRHFMRCDAEAIMVDYMPDKETMKSAQFAAQWGHLVLAGFLADDAAAALVRMIEVGSAPSAITDATRLICAQRLVRLLCPHCSKEERLSPELRDKAERILREGGGDPNCLSKSFRRPVGCARCRDTGFRGRTIVAEMLEITPEIGKALRTSPSVSELRTIAVGQGMTTMAADGVRRAAEGQTALSEVVRVLGEQV